MIGVSRITLHRRVRELGLEEETRYSEIDDQELDVFVRTILALLPNSGEVVIRGALCGRGVRIQRSRLRESIQRVDPTRRRRRQRLRIRRRVYSVIGSQAPTACGKYPVNDKIVLGHLYTECLIECLLRRPMFFINY